MQRMLFVLFIFFASNDNIYSQSFSINTDGSFADTSAILDIKSSAKGMLIPRMTKAQRNTIFQPAAGLMVFQNGPDSSGFYFFDGSAWLWMISTGNIQTADNASWTRTGNSGTNPAANFVGTTDNQPLNFKVNNVKAGVLDHINHNTSLGSAALINYTGINAVAVGDSALFSGSAGSDNTALGHAALKSNSTATNNVALGNRSLFKTTSGAFNTGTGSNSLFNNTTGHDNSAAGYQALFNNTGGFENTASGVNALFANTTGSDNTAIGVNALKSNTTGFVNTAAGFGALASNTTGSFNTAMGEFSLNSNITGEQNTATGNFSLQLNTTGNNNTASGAKALFANTGGFQNTASGAFALQNNTTGSDNTATGVSALGSNTTGFVNTATGFGSLSSNTTGSFNSAHGEFSLNANTIGGQNTANGNFALQNNTTGSNNIATGVNTLIANKTGNNNTAVGNFAGDLPIADNNNTFIGFGANNTSGISLINSTALGFSASVTASNQIRVGNTSVTSIGGQVGWTTLSDGRYKKNIRENVPGLSFILMLHPVTYNFDTQALDQFYKIGLKAKDISVNAKNDIVYSGFIAQEVERAAKQNHYDFSGVDQPKNEKDLYGLRYADFVVPLVKAIQEQQETISRLQKQLEDLVNRFKKLEKDK